MAKKTKIDPVQETREYINSSIPEGVDPNAKKELVQSLVGLLIEQRDKLPPRSSKYEKALQSIILALNTYSRQEEYHIGIWSGFDHLCMAFTMYSQLIWCTEKKSDTRDSVIKGQLHAFLLEIRNLWRILMSQYLDYTTKH